MGPPPRSFRCRCASLHHGLGLWPAAYKDVARMFVHHMRAPLGRRRHPDQSKCAAVLGAFKDEPSVGASAPILDRYCARRPPRSVWVGTKKRAIGRTKKLRDKKMDRTPGAPLDKNLTIQGVQSML